MRRIAIVGAGRVGETAAHNIAKQELAREVVLIDIKEGIPQGTALDIQESAPSYGFDTRVTGSTRPEALDAADLVVITAGFPRKEGQSRSDILGTNVPIIEGIVDAVKRFAPFAMILMVTNPVDVLTWVAWRRSGFPRERVLGLSGVLDAARMSAFVALETGFSVRDVTSMVLGGHGDTMVPLSRYTCVGGIPIAHFLGADVIRHIEERTRQGGAEILRLRKTSSAYDAPAAAIAEMVDAIVHDRQRVIPCVAMLSGEYGLEGLCMGVPVVLGAGGVQRVIELPLDDVERAAFLASAKTVQADIARL